MPHDDIQSPISYFVDTSFIYYYKCIHIYYIKYNNILIYVYLNYNNIVQNIINIIWKIKCYKII